MLAPTAGDGVENGRLIAGATEDAGGGRPNSQESRSMTAPTAAEMEEAREYAEIYALARGRVCAYLERASEEKGASKGAQFKLERIYGLGEKKEVTVSAGGGVEEFLRSVGGEAEY